MTLMKDTLCFAFAVSNADTGIRVVWTAVFKVYSKYWQILVLLEGKVKVTENTFMHNHTDIGVESLQNKFEDSQVNFGRRFGKLDLIMLCEKLSLYKIPGYSNKSRTEKGGYMAIQWNLSLRLPGK